MSKTDVKIIDAAMDDCRKMAGMNITLRAIIRLVSALREDYNENTSVKGVANMLRRLSRDANQFRSNLKAEYLKEHPEENLSFAEENTLLSHMFRDLRAAVLHFKSQSWWSEIPIATQQHATRVLQQFTANRVIANKDDLIQACREFCDAVKWLGPITSYAPDGTVLDNCAEYMCFQISHSMPDYHIFNDPVANRAAQKKMWTFALEQSDEWMSMVVAEIFR